MKTIAGLSGSNVSGTAGMLLCCLPSVLLMRMNMLKHRDFCTVKRYSSFQLLQKCTMVTRWLEPCGTGSTKDGPKKPLAATVTAALPFASSKDTCHFYHLHFSMPEQWRGSAWNPTNLYPMLAEVLSFKQGLKLLLKFVLNIPQIFTQGGSVEHSCVAVGLNA